MINNYFYELPQDLQDKIYCINARKYRDVMNNEFKSLFRASKYIDKVVYETELELINFMDYNILSSYENEITLLQNIDLLKDKIIDYFDESPLIKTNITMFYLNIFEKCSDDDNNDNDDNIIINIQDTANLWLSNMKEILLQNNSINDSDNW